MNTRYLAVAFILAAAFGTQACSGSTGAGEDEPSLAAQQQEVRIADIPAALTTTTETRVTRWSISKAGGEYVTRGLDAQGSVVSELHMQVLAAQGGGADVVLHDAATGGALHIDSKGNIVANTLPNDATSLVAFQHAHEDIDTFRGVTQSVDSNATAYMRSDCALWILGAFGSAIGAGAGCLPCAAGVVAFTGAAILDC